MNRTLALTKKYTKKYLLLIIAIVFLLLLAIPYALGYRIGPGVKLERVGTLDLTGLPKGASVYVDQTLEKTTTKSGDLKDELVGGSHSIIVSVPGDYPWNTIVTITSRKTTTVNPIFVGESPIATLLTGTDRDAALAGIASTTLPTEARPLLLANGCATVYVSNNQILAEATTSASCAAAPSYLCDNTGACSPTIIFSPVSPLKIVAKYPYRQDALVVQLDNVLYAIALDPRSPQFFAPILTATQPIIGTLPDGTIVVHNGNSVFRITL
jgi:hypothetical protein